MKRLNLQPLTCLVLLLALSGCGTLQKREVLPDPLSVSLAQTGIPSTSVALDIRSVDGERLLAHVGAETGGAPVGRAPPLPFRRDLVPPV